MRRLSASNLEKSFLRSFRRVVLTSSDSLFGTLSGLSFTTQKRLQFGAPQSDHYRTLGVKPDATPDEIKAAYKKLALEFHPDRNKSPGAEDKFKSISEAYSVVGNKSKRKDYDSQRSFGGGFSQQQTQTRAGGAYPGNPFMNQNYQPAGGAQYRQMTKEEADLLFRELFGGINVDQIFKDAERQVNRAAFGGMHRINFREFGSSAQFRPHMAEESRRSWTDEYGNKMEEKVFTTSDGTKYTVHNHSSTQPGASVNQTSEDFYQSVGGNSADGRAKFGTSSFRVNPRNFTNDFGQNYFGVRTHGRHPLVGLAIIVAWTIVITTLIFGLFSFAFTHPIFVLAIIGLIYLRRMRYY